jgi:hypothetical protein
MYKLHGKENVFIADGKKLAIFFNYFEKSTQRIRYEVRAGRNGKGKLLAKEKCTWGYISQKVATDKIAKKLGGLEFCNENNYEKFIKANAIIGD